MRKKVISVRGAYRDVLLGTDNQVIHDSGWRSNTIMNACHTLLAGFMKNGPHPMGIQHMAVGQGLEEWDSAGAPVPKGTETDLQNKYAQIIKVTDPELKLEYLSDDDSPSNEPTSRLQITATLVSGYPPPLPGGTTYPLREFGLFGRFNEKDFMINNIRHPVIHKIDSAKLIRVVRLSF